jgi:hypothetical protein
VTPLERTPNGCQAEVTDALNARGSRSLISICSRWLGPWFVHRPFAIGIATIQGFRIRHPQAVAPGRRASGARRSRGRRDPAGTRVGAWMDAHRLEVFSALFVIAAPGQVRRR